MANDTISDIADSILGGDNTTKAYLAGEASLKAGMPVFASSTTAVKMIDGTVGCLASGFAGIVKERYDTGINVALSNAQPIEIVTEGIVAVFCDDPGASLGAGVGLHISGAAKGKFGFAVSNALVSGYRPVAKTIRAVASGDDVVWARLL